MIILLQKNSYNTAGKSSVYTAYNLIYTRLYTFLSRKIFGLIVYSLMLTVL